MEELEHFIDWRNIGHDDSVSDKTECVVPDGSVPIERVSDQRQKDIVLDRAAPKYQPSNPSMSPAGTTWLTNDLEPDTPEEVRRKFNRLHSLQHGRGHTYEGYEGQRIHQQTIDKHIRCDAILQGCEVSDGARSWALQKLMTEDLRGFNSHYEGIDGAAFGIALLVHYDSRDAAKTSNIAEIAGRTLPINTDALVDYVFRRWS